MKIQDIFAKDINRKINPAVVVTERDQETIETEIEEYVFTQDLINSLYSFLNSLLNNKEGKTGIWINGFYGSGKSHFIKYIHYCLDDKTREKAFDHYIKNIEEIGDPFSEATASNVLQLKKKIISCQVDDIMFNIDAVSGQKDEKEKITKILFNQFNEFRGYNKKNIQIAVLIEKHLDKLGVFSEFIEKINSLHDYNWERDASTLVALKLGKVLEVVKSFDDDIDIDFLREKIKNPDDITIKNDLIPEFLEFLEDKPKDYRLLFLIDEVSQYIGSNTNLLLNLQTIIEEIAAECRNMIWIACTAQQSLEHFVENTEISDEDFGKILGRFETRIGLQSQDAAYITKRRVLDKNSAGAENLADLYKIRKDAITNQFYFSHDLYKGYENQDEFLLSYPFIPYQFRLISDVFESFSNLDYVIKEVKDNERSVIGITHFTAKKFTNKDTDYFIPFDAFFNELFQQNLTHSARRIIDRAWNLECVKNNPFAKRVVDTLFMISNLSDTKSMTFPANLDNLVILLMEETDQNKLEMQKKIQSVLEELADQHIIREENGQYRFFKEDEIDVSSLIHHTTLTFDDRLTYLYQDIFSNIINLQKRYSYGTNNFNLAISFDDKEIFPSGDIKVTFSVFDKFDINERAMMVNREELVICINFWFLEDNNLKRDFEQYAKTKKYIRNNFDTAAGTRRKTIEDFAYRNSNKLEELRQRFAKKFSETPFISSMQVIQSSEIRASSTDLRYGEVLEKHFGEIYKKHHLAKNYASTIDELKRSADDQQMEIKDTKLTDAEEIVDNQINLSGGIMTVDDGVKMFSKPPYGWKDISTIDVLVHLGKKNKRQFEWRSDLIDLKTFVEKAIKTNERQAIVIKSVEEVDKTTIHNVISTYRYIFNESLIDTEDVKRLLEDMKSKINRKVESLRPYNDMYYGSTSFGIHFKNMLDLLNSLSEIRDPKRLFENIIEQKEKIKELSDNCKDLVDFVDHQYKNYKAIRDFSNENQQNFSLMEEDEQEKASKLEEYLKSDDIPSERFPQIRILYKELKESIKDLIEKLQAKALDVHTKIYDELDSKTKEYDIPPESVYEVRESKLGKLKKENKIANLKFEIANAPHFKSESLKKISDQKNKPTGKLTVIFKVQDHPEFSSTIENEEQLEKYIAALKEKLQQLLKKNKNIIIQ